MRNLRISSKYSTVLPEPLVGHSKLTSIAVDVDNKIFFGALERIRPVDGQLEVAAWMFENDCLVSDYPTATLSCTPRTFSPIYSQNEVVSFVCLAESRKLCLIVTSGDIGTFSVEDEGGALGSTPPREFEIVGSVDSGIKAARWSPDEDVLVIITGNDEILLMTKDFDILFETFLRKAEFGADQNVNVGWGSKTTQFHGSLGKTAAAASAEQSAAALRGGSSPDDDGQPRVSWRGDGAFFVVSSVDPHEVPPTTPEPYTHVRRVLRVYDRTGELQSTSEAVPGLEQAVSWKPSGALITSTQRFGFPGGGQGSQGRHDVVFFERNGLRHGEFGLRQEFKDLGSSQERRWGYRAKETMWSSDSNVLAVWIERDDGDIVQLWTIGNYHWYLKQELLAPARRNVPGRFTSVLWHPEDPSRLITTTNSQLDDYSLVWDTCISRTDPPNDSATVAVVDGASLLMTPFRVQNVPPPMSSYQIERPSKALAPPVDVSFTRHGDGIALLYHDNHLELWNLRTNLQGGQTQIAQPSRHWQGPIPGNVTGRQVIAWLGDLEEWCVAILGLPAGGKKDVVAAVSIRNGKIEDKYEIALPSSGDGRLMASNDGRLIYQSRVGELLEVDYENEVLIPIASFPEFCTYIDTTSLDESTYGLVGLASKGKLHFSNTSSTRTYLLSTNCTSFTIGGSFLTYTTSSHEASFVPLSALLLLALDDSAPNPLPDWEKRRVERGSRIVVAVPSTMSLVLQMPRGNLETINPRPLVLEVVKRNIDKGDYRTAFLACRKHRIDLNILIDHNPDEFMKRLTSFTQQVHEVDYLSLFLSGVGQSSQEPQRIAEICDAIREELERQDVKKYVNSILTAHVVKTPPDYEGALSVLLRLQATETELVEDAVKYVIFLVDADRLFDIALGMYDFSLVLLIAQHSQRDPREYLPFLRELRALEVNYQKYRIDDHLKRYLKALQWLHDAGPNRFTEAQSYIEKHKLHREALQIWKEEPESLKMLLDAYGDYLFERRDFASAALAFVQAEKRAKAMVAYEKAHLWQELFTIATMEGTEGDDLSKMGYRVAGDLSSRKRHSEAGRVLLDYCNDVPEAISAYAQGNALSEAGRLCAIHGRKDLVETVLHPSSLDLRAQIAEDLEEMIEQFDKQAARLVELKKKKETNPDAFYMIDDPTLHNVDVMTDAASTVGTTFTRYTVAPSATSRKTKSSSKSKRKSERNQGKKGTINEEEYILESIAKLPSRLHAIQSDAGKLLPHLLLYSEEHRREGHGLQEEVTAFEARLRKAIDEIWDAMQPPDAGGEEAPGSVESGKQKPKKPEFPVDEGWKVKFLEQQ